MTGQIDFSQLRDDLTPFSDLGTNPPEVVDARTGPALHFFRHGEPIRIEIEGNSLIEFAGSSDVMKYSNIRALLASDRYGGLREWAKQQALLLSSEGVGSANLIEIQGYLDADIAEVGMSTLDDLLAQPQPAETAKILLIDGPAGIGKTRFITELAYERARSYTQSRRSLLLHVESRGRQLSYIYDLIAYSLQRIRSDVTFDQVPVLTRYGLITIAIDGFDELADPNGYNLAWAQVNELVESVRGEGQLILAGRETFIGRERVINDIRVLRDGVDPVHSFTLAPPSPSRAKAWLASNGLSEEQIAHLDDLLERGSLALRPFFLAQIAHPDIAKNIQDTEIGGVLNLLIEAMIARESTKFGDVLEKDIGRDELRRFLQRLMREVARDMADNQTSAISETTLAWLVEFVAPKGLGEPQEFTLKNRAPAVGFLTLDSRPRYLRFYHEKFFEYFLSIAVIDSVLDIEVAKFISRNLFGSSFLETIGIVLEAVYTDEQVEKFFDGLSQLLKTRTGFDRSKRNLGSFALAVAHLYDSERPFVLENLEVDEARISGSAGNYTLAHSVISQLDVRGADISHIEFEEVTIVSMIANENALFPVQHPIPQRLIIASAGTEQVIHAEHEISHWIARHSINPPEEEARLLPSRLYDHPVVKLLGRATRLRQYWMRSNDDKFSERILFDPEWKRLERLLQDSDLLKVEFRQASGPDARFIHIKYAEDLLDEDVSNPLVARFYEALRSELISDDQ